MPLNVCRAAGHEDILEHAPHFLAARGKIAEDHADVLGARQHFVACPLRGEVELGSRVVRRDD